ncbi:MAG: hypothetical protein HYZ11_03915 [Candidatus Tectomicrobia bacterium]|uniref:Multidrug transporter n=1 Tax=Tectimicrobiota bacterium TaxID=2528274 RepID=A0A932MMP0_UNCTE|nr:hypothetical protein [Candidatus Tectomicrobia bacterium]
MLKTPAAALLAAILAAAPLAASAASPSGPASPYAPVDEGAVVVDLLLTRPFGLVAVAAGLVLYLPAALIQSIGGNPVEPIADALVRRPIAYTFERPLGHFPLD